MACRDTSSTEAEREGKGRTWDNCVHYTTLGAASTLKGDKREIGPGCLPSVLGMYGDPFTREEISYLPG